MMGVLLLVDYLSYAPKCGDDSSWFGMSAAILHPERNREDSYHIDHSFDTKQLLITYSGVVEGFTDDIELAIISSTGEMIASSSLTDDGGYSVTEEIPF